jgi:hypothetical protein
LQLVTSSTAAATNLAENYVGLALGEKFASGASSLARET